MAKMECYSKWNILKAQIKYVYYPIQGLKDKRIENCEKISFKKQNKNEEIERNQKEKHTEIIENYSRRCNCWLVGVPEKEYRKKIFKKWP